MKVMCLGDNSSNDAWAHRLTEKLAKEDQQTFRGMVPADCSTLQDGYYHIGPIFMKPKDIMETSKNFDQVILLDQTQDQFSDHRIFLGMFKLVNDMAEQGIKVIVKNAKNMEYLYYWTKTFDANKSVCVYPWLLMHDGYGEHTTVCGRSVVPVAKRSTFKSWEHDKDYNHIRDKMVKGIRVKNCQACHAYEDKGIRDQRWNYSFDWLARLKIKNMEELQKWNKNPVYYEVRPSNKCNAMCRMCSPNFSHLIEKETASIKDEKFLSLVKAKKSYTMSSDFHRVDMDSVKRLYISGGEPTIMPEVYSFLRACVEKGKTDFKLHIQTNNMVVKDKFFEVCKPFTDLTINSSIYGVGKVNEYVRWLHKSPKQIQNIKRWVAQGTHVHVVHVVSIYNVFQIGEMLEYFDKELPEITVQLQWADFSNDLLNPYNHPNRELVFTSLTKAKQSKCYWGNESGTTNIVNDLYDYYKDKKYAEGINHKKLKNFFYYNDFLDRKRGIKLVDYIPELAECRKHMNLQ